MAKDASGLGGSRELAPTRQTLVERLRNLKDHESWQDFFNTYWKLIYCAAKKSGLSDQEAEDVVQETVSGVAQKMETFQYDPERCSFKGWLMHITRRRIIDHLRKRKRHEALPVDSGTATSAADLQIEDAAAARAFERLWDEEWRENLLEAAMERVKRAVRPEHYQIFYLHAVKNMPARQISELMSVSATKVYVVQHRIARLLKREVRLLNQD